MKKKIENQPTNKKFISFMYPISSVTKKVHKMENNEKIRKTKEEKTNQKRKKEIFQFCLESDFQNED